MPWEMLENERVQVVWVQKRTLDGKTHPSVEKASFSSQPSLEKEKNGPAYT